MTVSRDKKKKHTHGQVRCAQCGMCCHYVALEIDTPRTVRDFNYILWYVIHEGVWVYVDTDNIWHLQFDSRCSKLSKNSCTFYHYRPLICREYEAGECTYHVHENAEKYIFKNEDDFFRISKSAVQLS